MDGSLLDYHTTPVKKGSASNLLQVKNFSLKYSFGRENSKFKFRKLRDSSMGNSIDGSLLDDHTTPVKKGRTSNLLQVKIFLLKYCFGRENSNFEN